MEAIIEITVSKKSAIQLSMSPQWKYQAIYLNYSVQQNFKGVDKYKFV